MNWLIVYVYSFMILGLGLYVGYIEVFDTETTIFAGTTNEVLAWLSVVLLYGMSSAFQTAWFGWGGKYRGTHREVES